MAKFFHDAEMQVRTMSTPPSLSRTQGQYVDAMALFANAAAEILKFTEDGDPQRLGDAHRMDVRASEDMLRVGEVLWPGQYNLLALGGITWKRFGSCNALILRARYAID